jgi:SAM-dependent methyltransferase
MSDVRAKLYEKYVSAFKGDQTGFDLKAYWKWCDRRFGQWFRDLPRTARVLELGCGPGYMLGYLSGLGFTDVSGIDISVEQVALARAAGHRAEVADVFAHLADRPAAFDLIVGLDFLEHFTRDELGLLAQVLHRALAAGGRLIAQTPNGEGLFPRQIIYGDLTHATILTPGSFRQLFTVYGFAGFEFRETGPAAKNLAGVIRLGLWKGIRLIANMVRRIEAGKTQAIWTENMLCRCEKPVAADAR